MLTEVIFRRNKVFGLIMLNLAIEFFEGSGLSGPVCRKQFSWYFCCWADKIPFPIYPSRLLMNLKADIGEPREKDQPISTKQ